MTRALSSRGRERLRHVVVDPRLEPGDLVGLVAARGHHDHRQLARPRIAAELLREREARQPGQHPVEEHEVGQLRLQHLPRGLGVGGAFDVVARVDEVDLEELEDRRLVLDDHDRRHHGSAELRADLVGRGVPHVDALDRLDDGFRDVLRVIPDPLDRLGDEHDLERRRDRARILHHVADQLPHDRVERRVDGLVVADHLGRRVGVEPREGVERRLQHRAHGLERARDVVVAKLREAAAAARLLRLERHLLRLVADPLEVVDDLGHGHDHPEVDRRRLPLRDDLRALLVDLHLHPVDRLLVGADLVDQVGKLLVGERRDRAAELLLDEAAHREHAAPDRLHLGVELLVRVFGHDVHPSCGLRTA